ncbi:MAG: hypothetical protein WCS03_12840 [Bacteroidota bacterium]
MRTIKFLVTVLIAVSALCSCRKIEKLPPVPRIEFTSFAVFDTIDILGNSAKGGRLKFYFEDGDGDLGLKTPSENQPDATNLFFTLFRKTNGDMVPSGDNDPFKPSSYRIPYMERLGQNKILKGTISVIFLYLFYSPGDTIKYDFYIQDRALNESNIASTSEIIISVNDIYIK